MTKSGVIKKGLNAKKESKYVEFKSAFDPDSSRDWVEIVKDIVAIANSGGGVIVFGLDNKGNPSGFDASTVLSIDPARWTDKIARYTGTEFSDFEIVEKQKAGTKICAMKVDPVSTPLVFIRPGTYNIGSGGKQKQHNAFSVGTVYFRHGAKSEPGNRDDLQRAIQRKLKSVRKSWLKDVRKVVNAPAGYEVKILPPEVTESTSPLATPIRITDDPEAPSYRVIDPDVSYPFRHKEVIEEVNKRLASGVKINSYDILAARRVWNIKGKTKYTHQPKFGSLQYSHAFVDWLVKKFQADPEFFTKARRKYYELQYGSGQKR